MKNVKLFGKYADKETELQVKAMSKSPVFKNEKIAIMPDNHLGKGACIGFTATFGDKIIPNVVGVDIGCGMTMTEMPVGFMEKYNENKEEALKELQTLIRKNIPYGNKAHKSVSKDINYYWKNAFSHLSFELSEKDIQHFVNSTGSLGGGNHFIELNEGGLTGGIKLIIHSGSRGLGTKVASHHQRIAEENFNKKPYTEEELKSVKPEDRKEWIQNKKAKFEKNKPEKGLEYLMGSQVDDYLNDMEIAQHFAHMNRLSMIAEILKHFGVKEDEDISFVETIHNYIDIENKIIRKGAIDATEKIVIIPLNMRDGTIIGIGKANPDANNSAPHGAGRIMSRTKAKQVIKLEDFKETMSDVVSWTINENTIDEAPFAYKPKQEIIEGVEELVDVMEVLKPIFNFKDDSSNGFEKRKK